MQSRTETPARVNRNLLNSARVYSRPLQWLGNVGEAWHLAKTSSAQPLAIFSPGCLFDLCLCRLVEHHSQRISRIGGLAGHVAIIEIEINHDALLPFIVGLVIDNFNAIAWIEIL